jgi:hypothetical protein
MVALNTGSNTTLLQRPLGYMKADGQQVLEHNKTACGCYIQQQ